MSSDTLQTAIASIRSGDKETGKLLLAEVVRDDPGNETAWLWMSSVIDSDEHRRYCLERVLAINPHNETAQRGLEALDLKQPTQPNHATLLKIEYQTKPAKPSSPEQVSGTAQPRIRFDWQTSPAHMLLLSRFLHPRRVEEFAESSRWESALKEAPQEAVKRFLNDGMIERASMPALLDRKYSVSKLKEMLKRRGLPVSGRKADLIGRLVEADPEGMKEEVAGSILLQCSERGREVAKQYLASEEEKRATIEQQVLGALQERKFKDACLLVASFEAEQVFPRGLFTSIGGEGNHWKNYDPSRDVAMLINIFGSKPKILARLNNEQMGQLRVAAGMMQLWGTNQARDWLPSDFKTKLIMDNDTAARMLIFHADHRVRMEEYHELGVIRNVIISTSNDSNTCPACRVLEGKKYKLSNVPDLPYEKCTSKLGCRCMTEYDPMDVTESLLR